MSLLQTIPNLVLAGTQPLSSSGQAGLVLSPVLTQPMPVSVQTTTAANYLVIVNGSGSALLSISGVNNGNIGTVTITNVTVRFATGAYGSGKVSSGWTATNPGSSIWTPNLSDANNAWASV